MEKEKLERIQGRNIYTTGDNQKWTYEYTWEDFKAASTYCTTVFPGILMKIFMYFAKHPEKLLEDGIYKERGYTEEDIVKFIIDPTVCNPIDVGKLPMPIMVKLCKTTSIDLWVDTFKELSEDEISNFIKENYESWG